MFLIFILNCTVVTIKNSIEHAKLTKVLVLGSPALLLGKISDLSSITFHINNFTMNTNSIMKFVKLNSGYMMPMLGLG